MPHTPGPWSVMPTPKDDFYTHKIMYDCVQTHRRIGAVCGVFAKEDGEADANARLLAAAPELLAALRFALPVIESAAERSPTYETDCGMDICVEREAAREILRAITLAEGIAMEGNDGKGRRVD